MAKQFAVVNRKSKKKVGKKLPSLYGGPNEVRSFFRKSLSVNGQDFFRRKGRQSKKVARPRGGK